MALYAVDDDDLIHAADAEKGGQYWCLECFGPVKRRYGRSRIPHFYHVSRAPSCRLYSKSEDHLLVQIELQKLFPEKALQLERPFPQISRIADLCWEDEKIVFEIQCSPISLAEASARIRDYASIGYEIIWLLDDRKFNRRVLTPAEELLRRHWTYYLKIRRGRPGEFYDQFEVVVECKRIKKGKKFPLNLQNIRKRRPLSGDNYPKQILHLQTTRYIYKDRFHRALYYPSSMQVWKHLEEIYGKVSKRPSRLRKWLWQNIGVYFVCWIKKIWDEQKGLKELLQMTPLSKKGSPPSRPNPQPRQSFFSRKNRDSCPK